MNENQFDFFPSEPPLPPAGGEPPAVTKAGNSPRPDLFLIDAMALVYRAYFALQRAAMTTRDGHPTGVVFGFASTLLRLFEHYHPHYLAAAFDSREKTFRHELFTDYKANREAPPEELIAQLDDIFELLAAFGIPVLKLPGYEADDLIGTASRRFEDSCRVHIVTPDKDLSQLVHDGTTILKPARNQQELQPFGPAEVVEQHGVEPSRFIDYLALTGDTSDNIPGAKGIGPKTAAKLVNQYGSLEGIYENLDKLTPKVRKSLEEFSARRELVRELVTIRTDLALDLQLDELACREPDAAKLYALLDRLELKAIATRLSSAFPALQRPGSSPDGTEADTGEEGEHLGDPRDGADYRCIDTIEGIEELLASLKGIRHLAIDTETTSLDTFEAELAGISLSWKPKQACFISFANTGLDRRQALKLLMPLLQNPDISKGGQNLKYDILVLKAAGIKLEPLSFDTMLASYVLDPDAKHNLDDLAARHLKLRTTTWSELVGTGKARKHIYEVEPRTLTDYACQDADVALQLEKHFIVELEKEKRLDLLLRQIEFPLVDVLADMEFHGVKIDTEHLHAASLRSGEKIAALQESIHQTAGREFNIDSPKQLSNILFDVLGLPTGKATKTGWSTNVEVLEELAAVHPIAAELLEYRSLQKLKGTYIDALPKMVNPVTGMVHTSFNQHVTATGRLSSSNPNLQNIPIRTELGREIRRAFIPSTSESRLFSADYSQIELRIAAEISGDAKLIDAFRNREDIHAATARVIFDTDEVTPDQRRKAKEVNFGVLYGIQPFGLSRRLNIPRNEAKAIIDTYMAKYPGLFEALGRIVEEGRQKGMVATLLGRRRFLPGLSSRNANIRNAAERAAMNTPIQGTAADIIKYAMILCANRLASSRMRSVMILQVHDELVFEAVRGEEEQLASLVVDAMVEAAGHCGLEKVPVEVDTGIGSNWLEAH